MDPTEGFKLLQRTSVAGDVVPDGDVMIAVACVEVPDGIGPVTFIVSLAEGGGGGGGVDDESVDPDPPQAAATTTNVVARDDERERMIALLRLH